MKNECCYYAVLLYTIINSINTNNAIYRCFTVYLVHKSRPKYISMKEKKTEHIYKQNWNITRIKQQNPEFKTKMTWNNSLLVIYEYTLDRPSQQFYKLNYSAKCVRNDCSVGLLFALCAWIWLLSIAWCCFF